jgi:beta-hydroxylase
MLPDDLPELRHLQASWETIRDEALALWQAGDIRTAAKHDDLAFNSFYKRDWRRFYVKWYGEVMPSARPRCPRTVAILAGVPSVHAAMFAVLAPRSHLVRHRDPFAGSLRYHLGLKTPNADTCRIFVDGQPYTWHDGEGVLFDETYIHRAETAPTNRASSSSATSSAPARTCRHRGQSIRDPTSCPRRRREHRRGSRGRTELYTVRLVMKRLKAPWFPTRPPQRTAPIFVLLAGAALARHRRRRFLLAAAAFLASSHFAASSAATLRPASTCRARCSPLERELAMAAVLVRLRVAGDAKLLR